jgi:hypothetical protein
MVTEPDLDHPGYLRHCVFPDCKAEYHAIRGAADGRRWYMGNSGPVHGKYICPDHIAIVRAHQPGWLRVDEPLIAMRCACGWEWTPEERSPAGVYLETWKFHVRDVSVTPGRAAC